MIIQKYCKSEISPYHNNMYIIHYNQIFYDKIGAINTSYHIFQSRIFGLTYANYLKMLRDNYNAIIIGKGHRYPVAYFKNIEDINKIIYELNKRFTTLFENL